MIKSIETRYAGCHFRSRLEARWAVFFDRLGTKWEYEQQGYIVGGWDPPADIAQQSPAVAGRPYLPDFWLPVEQLWVEVKGSEADLDHGLILDAVITHWGLPATSRGDKYRMLVLGPVPRPGGRVAHSILQFYKGDVNRDWAEFGIAGLSIASRRNRSLNLNPDWLGGDSGEVAKPDPGLVDTAYLPGTPGEFVTDAYTAARSARFEHGQSGA